MRSRDVVIREEHGRHEVGPANTRSGHSDHVQLLVSTSIPYIAQKKQSRALLRHLEAPQFTTDALPYGRIHRRLEVLLVAQLLAARPLHRSWLYPAFAFSRFCGLPTLSGPDKIGTPEGDGLEHTTVQISDQAQCAVVQHPWHVSRKLRQFVAKGSADFA